MRWHRFRSRSNAHRRRLRLSMPHFAPPKRRRRNFVASKSSVCLLRRQNASRPLMDSCSKANGETKSVLSSISSQPDLEAVLFFFNTPDRGHCVLLPKPSHFRERWSWVKKSLNLASFPLIPISECFRQNIKANSLASISPPFSMPLLTIPKPTHSNG